MNLLWYGFMSICDGMTSILNAAFGFTPKRSERTEQILRNSRKPVRWDNIPGWYDMPKWNDIGRGQRDPTEKF